MPEVPCRGDVFHALQTVQSLATLLKWLREDVLSLGGPNHATRRELFDFVVAELRSRQPLCPHRIGPVVRAVLNVELLGADDPSRWPREAALRSHLGPDYLALLQFFLNHRRFLRSERPERTGKSPAELLGGSPHPHWLEMLGLHLLPKNGQN